MAGNSVRVIDNTDLVNFLVKTRVSTVNRLLLEEAHMISLHRTPMKTGALRTMVQKVVDGESGEIRWNAPYAIYQEEKQFTNYTTPGTGPHFAESAMQGAMDKLQDIWEETE